MATSLNDYWAKGVRGTASTGESLLTHTLHVLKRLAQLRDRAPFLAELCGDGRLFHRLALAVVIHDLGKVDPRFQQVLRATRNSDSISYGHRHEVLSLAWMDWLLGNDSDKHAVWLAAAVASHHRDYSEITTKYLVGPNYNPAPNVKNFVTPVPEKLFSDTADLVLREIIPIARQLELLEPSWEPPAPWAASTGDRDRAISSIRRHLALWEDWMADAENKPFDERLPGFLLRGLIILADHAGSAHEDFIKFDLLSQPTVMAKRLAPSAPATYYPHQDAVAEIVGHAILVAPTGSGKTEAALRWAARQYEMRSGHPPLFYVLPFKASMNAMQLRLQQRLTSSVDGKPAKQGCVTLQHSSAMQVLYHQLMSEAPDRSTKQAEGFVRKQRNLARLHTTPIRVLSPYQILRAAYQLKGHEAIWTDAAGGLFIVDEIHAYEPQKLARILEMLRFLVDRLGAHVFVMTATMPKPILQRVQNLLGNPQMIHAADETFARFRRHRLNLCEAGLLDKSTIRQIVMRVQRAEAVLCVATTVGRAQSLQSLLQNALDGQVPVRLLHSRFTSEDRSQKEKQLHKLVSTELKGKRAEQVVLVATQVVEVSLDVDFDVLFSDPAPLDALVQRFGRVNRDPNRRTEPSDVVVCTPLEDSQPVYCPDLVTAAIEQLRPADGKNIDERDIQTWLDGVYQGPIATKLSDAIAKASDNFRRFVLDVLMPFETNEDLEGMFLEQFDGLEVLPEVLVERYRSIWESEPLAASMLTVPISYKQFKVLQRKGLVRKPESLGLAQKSPPVVSVAYDSESGLLLNPLPKDDNS